jgi:hypothetical protein
MSRQRTRKSRTHPVERVPSPSLISPRLDSLGHAELLDLWRAYGGRGKPPQRRFMIRDIAFRAAGGMDYGDFERLLTRRCYASKAAMRIDAFVDRPSEVAIHRTPLRPHVPSSPPAPGAPSTTPALPSPLVPASCRHLARPHVRGHRRRGGKAFVYDGTTYRSLSRVASVDHRRGLVRPEVLRHLTRQTRAPGKESPMTRLPPHSHGGPPRPPRLRRPTVRCAVYTRKSSEEGLDMAFNSLDAQREAGLTTSRASAATAGSPSTTLRRRRLLRRQHRAARPERLLADIRARRVDIVVVYKVDRLSRSLNDFARLMQTFDEHRSPSSRSPSSSTPRRRWGG